MVRVFTMQFYLEWIILIIIKALIEKEYVIVESRLEEWKLLKWLNSTNKNYAHRFLLSIYVVLRFKSNLIQIIFTFLYVVMSAKTRNYSNIYLHLIIEESVMICNLCFYSGWILFVLNIVFIKEVRAEFNCLLNFIRIVIKELRYTICIILTN